MESTDNFRTVRQIASALGTYKRKVLRLARREGWPSRRWGNHVLLRCPQPLQSRLAPLLQPGGQVLFPPQISAAEHARIQRAWWRFQALYRLSEQVRSGVGIERALCQTASELQGPSLFHCKASSLRKWGVAYARQGLQGLQEHKLGRSGRKRSTAVSCRGLAAS